MANQIKVGVAVFIINDQGLVLVGKRLGPHGTNTWSVPGGGLEYGETIAEAIKREVFEETGLEVLDHEQIITISDVVEDTSTQWITIWSEVRIADLSVLVNAEPNKCAGWEWHDIENIPQPHFRALSNFLTEVQTLEIRD